MNRTYKLNGWGRRFTILDVWVTWFSLSMQRKYKSQQAKRVSLRTTPCIRLLNNRILSSEDLGQ
jgi:hypothetical protein